MRPEIGRALTALGILLAAGTLWAHHSPSAEFDMSKRFTLSGTLTSVDWVNPHIDVFMEVKGANGQTESWKLETNPPAWFKRVGVNKTDFAKAIGQTVTVEGNRAKDGSAYAYMLKITFADGSSMELVSNSQTDGK